MPYTNKNWGKGNRLTRKNEKRANKQAIKKGRINLARELNRKTDEIVGLKNNPIKGAVPVKQSYRDIKELIDRKKLEEYLNDFSDSFSRRRSSSSRRRRSSSRRRRRMSSRKSS